MFEHNRAVLSKSISGAKEPSEYFSTFPDDVICKSLFSDSTGLLERRLFELNSKSFLQF